MEAASSTLSDGGEGSVRQEDGAQDRTSNASNEEEASEDIVPPSPSSLDAILTRQHWYLGGEVSTEAALSILAASDSQHCYGVYRNSDKEYVLSTKILVEDVPEPIYEHLQISTRPSGKFIVSGQANSHEDIPEAVQQFVLTFDPPLVPALQVTGFDTQISIADDPPDYERANKVLKPDVAPLPNIRSIAVDKPMEAKAGHLSPAPSRPSTGTAGAYHFNDFTSYMGGGLRPHTTARHPTQPQMNSQWHRYPNRHRCHPKNVCAGCCYRRRRWNGHSYDYYYYEWYDIRGNGPLRLLALLLFYCFCGICFSCKHFGVLCCIYMCAACCGWEYDS